MESGYTTEPEDLSTGYKLTLEDAVAMSDELLSRPTALEDAEVYFKDLETSSPALFKMIADAVGELYVVPIRLLDSKGKYWYRCVQCGKLHDRESRAIDCRNSDLNLRPYKCHGECGNPSCAKEYWSEELLDRHRDSARPVDCSNCDAQVLKQNLSRHRKSCKKGD